MLSRLPEIILDTAIRKHQDSLQKVINRYRSGLLAEDECRNTCKEILYKELFYRAITDEHGTHNPPILLEPFPDNLITPDIHAGHFPTDLVIGWDIWHESIDALEEAIKRDMPVILTDHYGLKTYIKLLQNLKPDRLPVQTQGSTKHLAEYIGTGTIEGYTSERPREIKITVSENGQIRCLFTKQDHDDNVAFQSFPLWKDYHQKLRELEQEEEDIITKLMEE